MLLSTRHDGPAQSLRFLPTGLLLPTVLVVACGGPLPSADAPPGPVAAVTSSAAVSTADASPPAEGGTAYHTMTVTQCGKDPQGCGEVDLGGPGYRFAFGASAGRLRTREQAIADLYREIRDRGAVGTRLEARSHRLTGPGDAATATPALARPSRRSESEGDGPAADELIATAQKLLTAVDTDGQVTVDVSHGGGTCKLSLAADGATSRECLILGPVRPGSREPEGPRHRDDSFGKAGAPGG